MKYVLLILAFVVSTGTSFSQNTLGQIRNLVSDKEYDKAGALIPQAIGEEKKNAKAFELFGDIYYELEKLDSANMMYQRSYELDKENKFVMRKYAKVLAETKQIEEALKMIDKAIKEDKKDVYNYIQKGLIYVQVDSFQLARSVLSVATDMDKSIPDAFIALGDLYYAWKVYDPAITNYEQALALDEKLIDARIKLATSYYWRANSETDSKLRDEYFNRSLVQWNRVGKDDPKNAKAFYQQGRIFYLASRWGNSAQAFIKYVDLRPDGHLGRWYLAQCLVKIDSCNQAIPHLEIVMNNIDSVKYKACMELARCNSKLKIYEPSIKYFEQCKNNNIPFENNDYFLYANSLFQNKDTLKAIDVFKNYFELEKSKTDYMAWFAVQLFKRKSYDDAIIYYQKVIDNLKAGNGAGNGNNGQNGDNGGDENGGTANEQLAKMYYYIGLSHQNMTRPKEASDAYQLCIGADSSYVRAYVNLADSYANLKMMPESIEWFNKAIEKGLLDTAKNMSSVRNSFQKLAGIYMGDKKFNELKELAERWTKADAGSSNAWFVLGYTYHNKQDKDNACRCYKKAIALDKNNTNARKQLAVLDCNGE